MIDRFKMISVRFLLILTLIHFGCCAEAEKSYDQAQLLQLLNFTNSALLDAFTNQYGGSIWKEDLMNNVDIMFEKANLDAVKDLLTQHDVNFDVLISNLQSLVDSSRPSRSKRSTTMNWSDYQRFDTIVAYLNAMQAQYPNIVTVLDIGTTIENRPLKVIRITANVNNKAIWIDGGIHAREWISPASVTYIINYLLTNWSTLPASLKSKTFYILPVMNPDGYEYTFTNDRLWRKNRKTFAGSTCVGVDLNRNFDIAWTSSTQSTNKCSETYEGLSAFSEKETTAVKNFLTTNKALVNAVLTYHSYGQYILWPWGWTYSGTAPNASAMKTVADTAAANIKALTGTSYTAVRDTALGLIAGATDDWAKQALNIPFTYTIELRDTGTYGFVLPAAQIIPTAKEALEVVKAVAAAI